MPSRLIEIFQDNRLVERIKDRLPKLFQIADLECSRAGKIGPEVGVIREKILVALLIHKFGEGNVQTNIPATKAEVDAIIFEEPISVKTITGKYLTGVKLGWTVDPGMANQLKRAYKPTCNILFAQIIWGGFGGLYSIPVEIQNEVMGRIGRDRYIKLPTPGTNPRGVEFTKEAMTALVNDGNTQRIAIEWIKTAVDIDPYKRWVDRWNEE